MRKSILMRPVVFFQRGNVKLHVHLLTIGTLFLATILAIACSTGENEQTALNTPLSDQPIVAASRYHSESLAYCLKKYEDELIKHPATFSKNGDVDTLAIYRFFEEQTYAYLQGNPISYNNISLGVDYYLASPDSIKVQEVQRMSDISEFKSGSQVVKNYYLLIRNIIGHNEYTLEQTNNALDEIFIQSQIEISDENDKRVAQIMIGVASDSYQYWNTFDADGHKNNAVDPGIIMADISGAGGGALWGSVAGPLGAVMMGINFGIIHSGVAYAISHAHCCN